MRVLLFRSLCDSGGVSTSMQLLGNQLTRRGIACEYWFCRPSNRLPEFMATGRATLAPLSKLAARLERGEFDVIHMTASDEYAPFVARMAGRARVVVTARGALAEGWNHRTCFAYTAISSGMAEINEPYTDLEIEVVRNAIDVSRYSPPVSRDNAGPIVAFVGRTTHDIKDFPRFTRIAAQLVETGARVWIADPHGATWEKFANSNVREMPVERWSPVPNPDIPDFYRAIAASGGVVLMTSKSEGFGNVAPEAAACGARVAAPDVMGLREAVIDNVTGRLFDAKASDESVAGMLREYLAAPHDMQQVSEAAKHAFSASVLTDEYLNIFHRQQPRLQKTRAVVRDYAESALLIKHLMEQRALRARAALTVALDFASEGYADLAIGALAYGARVAPAQYVTRAGSRQLLGTLRGLAGRSAVRRLASRLRRA
jgi:glycosyltransferase involved in cell wall biosynthesis